MYCRSWIVESCEVGSNLRGEGDWMLLYARKGEFFFLLSTNYSDELYILN